MGNSGSTVKGCTCNPHRKKTCRSSKHICNCVYGKHGTDAWTRRIWIKKVWSKCPADTHNCHCIFFNRARSWCELNTACKITEPKLYADQRKLSRAVCRADNHICICIKKSCNNASIYCRAYEDHKCSCRFHNPERCLSEDHECSCDILGTDRCICLGIGGTRHRCSCKIDPFECLSINMHRCTCVRHSAKKCRGTGNHRCVIRVRHDKKEPCLCENYNCTSEDKMGWL